MIDLKKYGINYDPDVDFSVDINDLVALANIERINIDSYVVKDSDTTIEIEGSVEDLNKVVGKYVVLGDEIAKISNAISKDKNTLLSLDRALMGTIKEDRTSFRIRSVVILDHLNSEIDLLDFSFENTIGNVSNNLFPVELSSGVINLKSELSLWSPHSINQKYRVRNRKSVAYIFKGLEGKLVLKHVAIITKLGVNSKGKKEPNRVRLEIKNVLAKWYDKDLAINSQLKGTSPRDFFKLLFGLKDTEVYYSHGLTDDSFLKINNLHTKEYKKVSEILKAYCTNGIRFVFDRFERVKIFSDFKVSTLNSQKTIYTDLTDATMTEDDNMIYNTINTEAVQRQTLYNFSDLNKKYVEFYKVKRNVVNSTKLLTLQQDGEILINPIEVIDSELWKSVQLKDYVLLKRTIAPYEEFYARVVAIETNNKVILSTFRFDKDWKLLEQGKLAYLHNLFTGAPCDMDLWYIREDLPMVWKMTKNTKSDEVDSGLMIPILPRVGGKSLYEREINAKFGSASNLKYGTYTGIVEEIDKIYGIWDKTKLLYNMEKEQFSNTIYPPIYCLSNRVEEQLLNNKNPMLRYTHFNNDGIMLEITKPKDSSNDATIKISNNIDVNPNIDLFTGQEVSRIGNRILEVSELSSYKLGDVLIANKPTECTPQEESEYEEVIKELRWSIVRKTSQVQEDGTTKHYIEVDSPFAKLSQGRKYQFTKFPNWSIVYLQELYFRGNPVIEMKQDVVGIAKGVNYEGDRSTDLYGEKKYNFDSKQLDKDSMKLMMGYILDNFQATNRETTKFNLPLSVFNGIDIEPLDIITVLDPSHTFIDEKNKWVVLSVAEKSSSNVVQIKALNINSSDTKPFKLDIKDVLEYKPVEIPNFDHVGGEGNIEKPNDGSGGSSDKDKALGQVWFARVDKKDFRAKIEKYENGYIYFKSLAGEKWEEYAGKLFPESEFAIDVGGEIIFVHSDKNYRAYIQKRNMYGTDKVLLEPDTDVSFLTTTTYVDIDGTFYGRRVHLGDGDTYLSVHPINGVKVVGDFVVGENNKHVGNDLWESLQKNKTFHLNTPPVSDALYTLRTGDIWYDLDDENHVYRYNGDVWVSCRDNSIISTQSSSFVQPDPPVATAGRPINNGDTWYDSDAGYTPYVYKDGKWINVTDKTLESAIADAKAQAEGALGQLSDLANDGKLTANEKHLVKKEWEVILAEYPLNITKAEAYKSSTTNYTNRYNILKTYIEPLLADLTSTSDIVGDTFRSHFKNYYEAEISLTGEIYDKVKESAVTDSKTYSDSIDRKLTGYMSDGVLTPQEKGDLKNEILTIENRASSLKARATVFGISTVNLTNYINKLITWKNGVLSQGGIYSDLNQVNILRADFRNYYTEEENVYDGIDKKAKELADKAQSDANGALGLLSDIASDNKFTPSEKQLTKKEWEIIEGEYPKILEESTKFGVNRTNYTNSYNSLHSYISPLIADLSTTSNIVGTTFRSNFKNYYDNRQTVLNAISTKMPEINSMQNGKMLYLDPTFKKGNNNTFAYNNAGNGLVTLSRMTGESFGIKPPNDSDMVLAISKQAGSTSPYSGGFYFGTPTKSGMKLLTKIVAYIPVGYDITWASNPVGNNSKNYWVTKTEGTGAFQEYVHVLECGTSGTFSSTSFFALKARDGNDSKAVVWGLSYATVFDAGGNQNEYVTEALGNSKIFYSNTAPISGMKTHDMWYDTDDGNHPYIYNGSIWISARDKIFETEGGNKVYFQSTTPPTTGKGIKEGDMWFKTNENNKMFILLKNTSGVLVWTLADDSLDKINTGRVVLNANTEIKGGFKVTGAQVELNAQTTINGLLEVYSNDRGIISYNGTTPENSTKRIVIKGGEILFQEKI